MPEYYSSDMALSNYSYDDDEEDDDDEDDDADEDSGPADGSAISDAPAYEQDAHREMLGSVLQRLNDSGIDIDELAENAGLESPDVTTLSNGDLANLTHYLAHNHPEVLHRVAGRYPAAQNILGALTGESAGF